MTPNAERVWRFVADYVREYRFAPSLREIADACFLSKAGVMRCLDQLDACGHITRWNGKARGMAINRYPPELTSPANGVKK